MAVNALVLAEHVSGAIASQTLSIITAASKLGGAVTVLVAGNKDVESASQAASKIKGVSNVITAKDASLEHGIAESTSALISSIASGSTYTHILGCATNEGKNIMPRIAAKLDSSQVSDVIGINSSDTFVRPMYAGNAIATVKNSDKIKVLTVRPTAFEKAATTGGSAKIEAFGNASSASKVPKSSKWISDEIAKSDRPDLSSASKVVSGGRALKSAENFKLISDLADKMGAAMGASRAAVDAGYVPNELQVGQTGKVVAPELYIAVGISGAIQHLAGMKDSKTIACINKDPEAPIFLVSDYGLVADLFKAVPEMTEKLSKKN